MLVNHHAQASQITKITGILIRTFRSCLYFIQVFFPLIKQPIFLWRATLRYNQRTNDWHSVYNHIYHLHCSTENLIVAVKYKLIH